MLLKTFSASWCAPCKVQKPIVAEWAKNHPDVKVEIISVEDPKGAAEASNYFVKSLPTLVFLSDDGTVLASVSGLLDARKLDSLFAEAGRRKAA